MIKFYFSFHLSTNFFCFTLGVNFQNFALRHLVSFANFDAAQMFPGKNVLRFIFWVKTRKTKNSSLGVPSFRFFVSFFFISLSAYFYFRLIAFKNTEAQLNWPGQNV